MHNRQLPRHGQHGALARRVRQLGRRAPEQRDHAGRVDDAAGRLAVPPHAQHGVLAAEPHPLDVDGLRQVPHLLRRVDRVGVVGVHDAGVVVHDVDAAPCIEAPDRDFDVGLLAHVAFHRFEAGLEVREDGMDFCEGGSEGGFGDVGHEDGGAFAGEEDGGFEADAAGVGKVSVGVGI